MYNIKQAAARAGVSVPVLRAWERRYGIVHPERTASGYRQFDEAAVERIKAMRALISQGWSPSAAAAAILAGTVAEQIASDQLAAVPMAAISAGDADQLAARLVAAAAAMDPKALDRVLDDLFSKGSFEQVANDFLFPALRRLGEAWATGQINVAGEHLASSAVHRRLGLALDAAASVEDRSGSVLVGLPPGGRHELGALAFAVAARRAGLAVSYLGPDLPVEDWIAAAADASAAVIGVVT
ncbi:MAG TPA: MerR family transcriptional regulator, partial [Candidatus Limnocylindria bacterium]|nr:MerR family transcriptional regulator [Candidatus Limnocylindria bacterium]